MPPRRRRQTAKATAPASRVHKIAAVSQWDKLMETSNKKLVVVQFYQSSMHNTLQMRHFFNNQTARLGQFKAVLFAEVDLDLSRDIGELAGVTRLPTYQCYWGGEMRSSYSGGQPDKVQTMVSEAQQQFCPAGASLARRLLTALAVVGVAAAGVYAAVRLGGGGGAGGGEGESELDDINRKLATAYNRLRDCERASRARAAVAQRKLIERLETRKRALERARAAREQGAAAPPPRKGQAPAPAPAQAAPAEDPAWEEGEEEEEEDEERPPLSRREDGRIVYSDEEEEEGEEQ